jgi:hypothetical protein
MLKTLVATLAIVVTLGVAKAEPPDPSATFVLWTLRVTDTNQRDHEYVVSPKGGPVRVDLADWKCSYDPVIKDSGGAMYTETQGVYCTTGKYVAASLVTCGPGSGWHSANLMVGAAKNKRTNLIVLKCDSRS